MRKLALLLLLGTAAAQTVLMPMPRQCFNDSLSTGKPLAGGKIYTYKAGTSVQQATYKDSTGLVLNTNPVILDLAGCASIWLTSGQSYRFLARNSAGAQEWVTDNVSGLATTSAAFAQAITTVTYSATPTFTATGQYQVFKMTLTGNVTSSTLDMSGITVPSLVTFEISQDAVGGRSFVWPLSVTGASQLNSSPVSTSTQSFFWDGTTAQALTLPLTSNNIVWATPGESVAHAVARLPVGGGKVIFDIGTYPSGGVIISTKNIWLEGSGMPNYNSATAPTALTGGTIFTGPIQVIQGGDHFVIRNAGVDTGVTWTNASNAGVATEGLVIYNNGQVVGAPQVQYPIIENVNCLGFSAAAAFHCMLVENVKGAYVHNVQTVFDTHGLVLKGQNSVVDGVYARGHSTDAVIIKSDDYAPTTDDTITNITIAPLAAAGDTKGMILQGVAAPLAKIQVSHVNISGAASWGIQVQGTSNVNAATDLSFTDIVIDYLSASPINTYCFQYVQYVAVVTLDNFSCFNYWAGIAPNLPQAGFTNDFSLSNGRFINIATNGVQTYGRWSIANSGLIGNAGTAITADANSIAYISNNHFASNGTDTGGAGIVTTGFKSLSVVSSNGTNMLCSGTLPTISAGFNGGTIGAGANGSCAFFVTIGAGGAVSTGVLTLPAATNGWNCFANNVNRVDHVQMTAGTTTSATLTNYGTTFAATNWSNGDAILVSCFAR